MTVLAQQRRALNLVDAILVSGLASGVVRREGRVAIIGAGAAGITAAAAFAVAAPTLDEIALYERTDRILYLQQHSDRYLHPHLYDWPAAGATRKDADLPILNWEAKEAGAVAADILCKFKAIDERSKTWISESCVL